MRQDRWLTPNVKPPTKFLVRRLLIPADYNYISIVNGALLDLTYSSNFEAFGDATPDECAKAFSDMYAEYCKPVKEAPGWEDDEDVDGDSGQPWYNDLADWIIKGFLVISGFPEAAIIYSTTVPKIRIAIQKHNLGALFRILLDNLEMYTGDSYGPLKELSGFTLDVEGFAQAHSLGPGPWTLRIEHAGPGASLPPGEDGELRVVRKRWTDEMPLQFRQVDPCLLEYSEDGGGNWLTAADLSLCSSGSALPSGAMVPFASGGTIPSGWLACDGAAVSRATYASLFAAIGTTWGNGDGSTTFNVPDLRGKTVVGSGQGSGLTNRVLGTSGGEETHQLSISEMPLHNHGIYPADTSGSHYYAQLAGSNGGEENINVTTYPRGSGNSHNNMQPFGVAAYIIKT